MRGYYVTSICNVMLDMIKKELNRLAQPNVQISEHYLDALLELRKAVFAVMKHY